MTTFPFGYKLKGMPFLYVLTKIYRSSQLTGEFSGILYIRGDFNRVTQKDLLLLSF